MNFNYRSIQSNKPINMYDDPDMVISKLMTENRDLLRTIDRLNDELKKKNRNDTLFKDNMELKEENKDLKKHIRKIESSYQRLIEKTQNYDNELKKSHDTINTLKNEILKLKSSKEELLEKCQQMIEFERKERERRNGLK